MAIHKPEWFKVDAAKFLSDRQVDAMSTEELGACFRLLCRQWIDGTIPDDLHLLGRLCRLDEERMRAAWVTIEPFFPVIEAGKRANRFMWIEREKVISDLERKSDEGTRAARKRWDQARKYDATPNGAPIASPNGSPMPVAMQDQTRPDTDMQDATGMPHPLPLPSSPQSPRGSRPESPNFNATEVAQILCQKNGWSGTGMIWALQSAIEFRAKRMPEAQLEQVGEWLLNAYSKYRSEKGKFAVNPQKFFEQGLYSGSSEHQLWKIKEHDPAAYVQAQMEAD